MPTRCNRGFYCRS